MKSTHRMAQLVAVLGAAVCISAVPAVAQDCPEFVGALDLGCFASDVALSPGYAFVACNWGGLVAVDVSQPSAPVAVGNMVLERAQHVAVYGDYAYVVTHPTLNSGPDAFHVVDISTPDSPVVMGLLSIGSMGSAGVVAATEGYAYVAGGDEVLVIDVSNPNDPTYAGALTFSSDGEVRDVAAAEDHAHVLFDSVVNDEDGLYVFDVGNPSQPVDVGFLGDFCQLRHICLDMMGHAYVTNLCSGGGSVPSTTGLVVVDVNIPELPEEIGGYVTEFASFQDVVVSGGYAYICDPLERLFAIGVSNPNQPTFAGLHQTLGSAESVAAGYGYVYVADGDAGLTIFRECGPFYDGFESGDTSAWSVAVP